MADNIYSVPSLSLSSSRSKKYIPTNDSGKQKRYTLNDYQKSSSQFCQTLSSAAYTQQKYTQSKPIQTFNNQPNIPKPKQYQSRPPIFPKNQIKEISRSVYLNNQQDSQTKNIINNIHTNANQQQQAYGNNYHYGNGSTSVAIDQARQILAKSTSQNLLRNPQSYNEVRQEISNKTSNMQFKKIDINKALFERKINKLIQQASFYDNQLDGFYSQVCKNQVQQLQQIAKNSMKDHQQILKYLNALIS